MVLLLASLGLGAPAALFDPGKKWIWSMYVFGGGTGGWGVVRALPVPSKQQLEILSERMPKSNLKNVLGEELVLNVSQTHVHWLMSGE